MTLRRLALIFICPLTTLSSCVQTLHAPANAAASQPLIVRVVSRNQTIEARASGSGPVYAMIAPDGTPLTAPTALSTIQQRDPRLANEINTLHADLFVGDQ